MELVGHDNEEMSQHYTCVGRTALAARQGHFLTFLPVERVEDASYQEALKSGLFEECLLVVAKAGSIPRTRANPIASGLRSSSKVGHICGYPLTYSKRLQHSRHGQAFPKKERSPMGGGGEHTGGSKPSRSQPNADKQSSYVRSRQLLKDLEESLLGWMVRNARSESEKAIYRFRQNLKQYLQEKSIPSEHLPAAFRDAESFNERVNFFAVIQIAQYLMECLIQGARDPNIRHTEASEALYIIAFDACAALRDIITKHSGTDAQRTRLAEIAKLILPSPSFPRPRQSK